MVSFRIPAFLHNTSLVLMLTCALWHVCGILCIVFAHNIVSNGNLRAIFYYIAATFCLLCTAVLMLARQLRFWPRHIDMNQDRCEFITHASMAVSSFVAGGIVLSLGVVPYTVAAFFALLAFCFYACNSYASFLLSRQRDASTQTEPCFVYENV